MQLVNWHWLEDLLVSACESEIQDFADRHRGETFFAFALEYDGINGELDLSYGTRSSVEQALSREAAEAPGEPVYYRNVELQPRHWRFARRRHRDPVGAWERVDPLLAVHRANMTEEGDADAVEFLWLRFEYLAECVVRRLLDRGAFRALPREPEFLVYAAHEDESLEELEERIARFQPYYRRATVELVTRPRMGELPPRYCQRVGCPDAAERRRLLRCTHCHRWYCPECSQNHLHPELFVRTPFFTPDGE